MFIELEGTGLYSARRHVIPIAAILDVALQRKGNAYCTVVYLAGGREIEVRERPDQIRDRCQFQSREHWRRVLEPLTQALATVAANAQSQRP